MSNPAAPFQRTTAERMTGPCKAYRGHAAGITTFNGVPIVVLARTRSELVDVIKEISPNTTIKADLFLPAVLLPASCVKDDDL